jgi:hypothetical protein
MIDYSKMDTSIYWNSAKKYIPLKINILFIGESPPAFKNDHPVAYFYFADCPKADSLFYSITKAIFNIDFNKKKDNRELILRNFANNNYFLIDAVEYPINKDLSWRNVSNKEREKIINSEQHNFFKKLECLKCLEFVDKTTKVILVKETVYNSYKNKIKNILNKDYIEFPKYIKDRDFIHEVRNLLNIHFD